MAISEKELAFNFNEDQMRLKISGLERELHKIYEGGGKKKIEKLQSFLANSTVVDVADIKTDKVAIFTTVKVLNTTNSKEMIFKIVPENEIDIKVSKISTSSPIGAGLLGKSLNEVCEVKTPAGTFSFKILEISI